MLEKLCAQLRTWCLQPDDIWDSKSSELLLTLEWQRLRQDQWFEQDYSTAGFVQRDLTLLISKTPIPLGAGESSICLETPYGRALAGFSRENGLILMERDELQEAHALEKLSDALMLLNSVSDAFDCTSRHVRVISVLASKHKDQDTSYSHPKIPFSVFVSVCQDRSIEAAARVAESILHEAMHLRLSLVQKVISLIRSDAPNDALYYSPWRRELRPANGVLHGIYVFRGILEFFRRLAVVGDNTTINGYAARRVGQITSELLEVQDFWKSPTLDDFGAALARKLVAI